MKSGLKEIFNFNLFGTTILFKLKSPDQNDFQVPLVLMKEGVGFININVLLLKENEPFNCKPTPLDLKETLSAK